MCLVAVRKCLIIRLTGLVCLCGHWIPPETNSNTHSQGQTSDIKTIQSERERERESIGGDLLVKTDFKREVMGRHNRTEHRTQRIVQLEEVP